MRAVLSSGDDYLSLSKPQIDWDDKAGREQLIDSRANDGHACLLLLDERKLGTVVTEAAELLATVLGQDLEQTEGLDGQPGVFRIARRVATDRVISTVDPQARHGHKTVHRWFDRYKGHIAVDPDSEIVTDTVVGAGNIGDAAVAEDLIDDLIGAPGTTATVPDIEPEHRPRPTVYSDSAYGSGPFLDHLAKTGLDSRCKNQPPTATGACSPRTLSTLTCRPRP